MLRVTRTHSWISHDLKPIECANKTKSKHPKHCAYEVKCVTNNPSTKADKDGFSHLLPADSNLAILWGYSFISRQTCGWHSTSEPHSSEHQKRWTCSRRQRPDPAEQWTGEKKQVWTIFHKGLTMPVPLAASRAICLAALIPARFFTAGMLIQRLVFLWRKSKAKVVLLLISPSLPHHRQHQKKPIFIIGLYYLIAILFALKPTNLTVSLVRATVVEPNIQSLTISKELCCDPLCTVYCFSTCV